MMSGKSTSKEESSWVIPEGTMTEEEDRKLALPIREVTRLFYNRVPKCGSTTTMSLFRKLAKMNGFHYPEERFYPDNYHFSNISVFL